MSFFTKAEIIARMQEKRAEEGTGVRADYNLALLILSSALFEQKLKSGEDYGIHPVHVGMTNTRSTKKQIVGILHDVVEDSDWELADLRKVGYSDEIVDAVDSMTHRPGELYFDSIERAGRNLIGTNRKLEDLAHNLDNSRNHQLPQKKDVERIHKYMISHAYLLSIKKGDTPRGTPVVDFVRTSPELSSQPEALEIAKKFSTQKTPTQRRAPGLRS